MASKPKKGSAAAETGAAGAVVTNTSPQLSAELQEVLKNVAQVSSQGSDTFVYVSTENVAALHALGYVVTNANLVDATGAVATRTTDAGSAAAAALLASTPPAGGFGGSFGGAAAGTTDGATSQLQATSGKPVYKLVGAIPLPEVKRGGGNIGPRAETYPFSTMEPGQAFFIAATKEKPNPERSFASSVASATQRYEVEKVPAEMRKNRKGRDVPVTVKTREFAIRRVDDGAAFGFPGVAGAGVWRTK